MVAFVQAKYKTRMTQSPSQIFLPKKKLLLLSSAKYSEILTGIFKMGFNIGDTPREVLNWKLFWSAGVFGEMHCCLILYGISD